MRAIGRSRTCLGLTLIAAALVAYADDDAGKEVHDMVATMQNALLTGNAEAFCALLDPQMPGYKKLKSNVESLVKQALAPSTIAFPSNKGDDHARDLELDWQMQIRSYNGETTVTRKAQVKIHAEKRGDKWLVTSLTPEDFFAPMHLGTVWDMIAESLGALTAISGDPSRAAGNEPTRFLAAFDHKMAGFDELRANVKGLLDEGYVDSTVVMTKNDGDDRQRTVALNWTLSVVRRGTTVAILRREQTVTCKVEQKGGKWRIVSFEPMSFLAPEKGK
jgi:hypothetical protein